MKDKIKTLIESNKGISSLLEAKSIAEFPMVIRAVKDAYMNGYNSNKNARSPDEWRWELKKGGLETHQTSISKGNVFYLETRGRKYSEYSKLGDITKEEIAELLALKVITI